MKFPISIACRNICEMIQMAFSGLCMQIRYSPVGSLFEYIMHQWAGIDPSIPFSASCQTILDLWAICISLIALFLSTSHLRVVRNPSTLFTSILLVVPCLSTMQVYFGLLSLHMCTNGCKLRMEYTNNRKVEWILMILKTYSIASKKTDMKLVYFGSYRQKIAYS